MSLSVAPLRDKAIVALLLVLSLASILQPASAQAEKEKKPATPGPMLSQGTMDLETPEFTLSLVRSSQTLAALKPKGADGFDFTPGDLLIERSQDGYMHLGDITLRLRSGDSGEWKNYSTSIARTPVAALPTSAGILAAADLAPTLPQDIPLQIARTWAVENGKLVLHFMLKNKSAANVQIGALGIPMIFNNREYVEAVLTVRRSEAPRPRTTQ
jgi:hypothetical protein